MLFANNMYLAYDALSDGMRRMLDGMTAMHSARHPYGPLSDWFPTQRAMDIRRSSSAQAKVEHRVIRTHP
jgi:taurine dioxygenase